MAKLTTDTTSRRMLAERLNHPIRLTRWSAAHEIAELLATEGSDGGMKQAFLDWLRTRTFESEIATGLSVLLCRASSGVLSANEVEAAIARPSPLAEMLLTFVFDRPPTSDAWLNCHSGSAPWSFEPDVYFLNNKGAQISPVLESSLRRLEKQLKMPFFKQWAFEWHTLMEKTGSDHSGFPYYFVDASLSRSGVRAQISQRQCDVYRSAYLRTLACASGEWGAPIGLTLQASLDTLPANRGLLDVSPTTQPAWLASELSNMTLNFELDAVGRRLIAAHKAENHQQLITLRTPLPAAIAEFGHLSIRSVLVTPDFVPNEESLEYAERTLPWVLPDGVSLEGTLSGVTADDYSRNGKAGTLVPLALDVFALPFGFWHGDYFQAGIAVPAPYACRAPIDLACERDRIAIRSEERLLADWQYWHDQWTPEYHIEGMTRVGCLAKMNADDVDWAAQKFKARLGRVIEVRFWTREKEYGEFMQTFRREFFFE